MRFGGWRCMDAPERVLFGFFATTCLGAAVLALAVSAVGALALYIALLALMFAAGGLAILMVASGRVRDLRRRVAELEGGRVA